MVGHLEIFFRMLRRWFSRSEWIIWLLGLSRWDRTSVPGLVLIQIDGLAFRQFERAMARGGLPFMRRLVLRERYAVHSLYSGMPSNTPGFQGEFFYGVKTCVPAFSFRDKKSGKIFKMYDSSAAASVEETLKQKGRGLLEGGSAYADIFTGGAEESHFCAAQMGWRRLFYAKHRIVLPLVWSLYADVFFRTFVLLVVEFFLAFFDCVRGTLAGERLLEELKFIPTRVAVCSLLKELTTIGAQIDIARGLPIIHVNFLGYDEQAHRRNPDSRFAHWSLRGIDHSVARLWQSARRSSRRYYDVWIYSDHGQENTRPYPDERGFFVQEAVSRIFGEREAARGSGRNPHGREHARFLDPDRPSKEEEYGRVKVAVMGPLGHVYPSEELDAGEKERLAERLVHEAGIPMVLVAGDSHQALAWTKKGKFSLPHDARELLGEDHPFLTETALDLVEVCHHPDAGSFVLAGWCQGCEPWSFPLEKGGHAGPGPHESNGFALLSLDAPLPPREREYLRPLDLREAALRFLGRSTVSFFEKPRPSTSLSRTLRVMTYNVHGCAGMDGRISPERIARVIARHDPDVVALQELDVERLRSGNVDQATVIARKLEMAFHFHPVFRLEDEKYGNAILSRYPMHLIRMAQLPASTRRADPEPRGGLWVALDVSGIKVQLINCHLSIWPHERLIQAATLTGPDWLSNPVCEDPVILCGDFNALPDSPVHRMIRRAMRDTQMHLETHRPHNTWLGRFPLGRIDHVFVGSKIKVLDIRVPATELDKSASDHLPLVVDVQFD